MAQIFHRSMNTIAQASILAGVLLVGAIGYSSWVIDFSSYYTHIGEPRPQPVQFSHKHHVSGLGIDCRYCHTSVEDSSFAGLPPTHTCMSCHSKIWVNSPMLQPVRASYASGKSLEWLRVNALPDFVYFNHSIHINKGIGCTTCHGPMGDMPITYRANTLYMSWCTNCHKHPEKYVRPRSEVFSATYQPPANQEELGLKLMKEYKIKNAALITDCYTCHR